MLNVRSVADMDRAIVANLHRLNRRNWDCVVGIPRSGMLAATLISAYLHLPLADLRFYTSGAVYGRGGRPAGSGHRVLLVDDSCNKGKAMKHAVQTLRAQSPRPQITRLAVYGPYQVEEKLVDISLEECQGPRAFTWNMWRHVRLDRWAVDMDGVLCRDPTREENDDGPRYYDFLSRAPSLLLPRRKVGHIVTGRLEKYRAQTEIWLKRHCVEYETLTMTQFESKVERMAAGKRGLWKAGVAQHLGVEFFIESNVGQARTIAREARIPVWCTATQTLMEAGGEG